MWFFFDRVARIIPGFDSVLLHYRVPYGAVWVNLRLKYRRRYISALGMYWVLRVRV